MKKTIYYMHKPGDARDYAMSTPPSAEWAQKQRAEGFLLYAVEIDVPTLVPTTGTLSGYCVPMQHSCSECHPDIGQEHRPDCVAVQRARDLYERTGGSVE